MIRVSGMARLMVNYDVDLDMTEEDFDAMSEIKQNELLESVIDWQSVCRSADVDGIEVDEIDEL